MKKSKLFFIAGLLLIVFAIIFIVYALNHPEISFPGGNKVAYPVYIFYFIAIITMFVLSKRQKN